MDNTCQRSILEELKKAPEELQVLCSEKYKSIWKNGISAISDLDKACENLTKSETQQHRYTINKYFIDNVK